MSMKIFLASLAFVALGFLIYYSSFFFRTTEINEPMPVHMTDELREDTLVLSKRGIFFGADLIHRGSGNVFLAQEKDKTMLRFEDFEVTNGPDLYVYLTKNDTPDGSLEGLGDFIDFGRLKGNKGNQNYEIEESIPSDYDTVVIWCKQFGVLFGKSNLRP